MDLISSRATDSFIDTRNFLSLYKDDGGWFFLGPVAGYRLNEFNNSGEKYRIVVKTSILCRIFWQDFSQWNWWWSKLYTPKYLKIVIKIQALVKRIFPVLFYQLSSYSIDMLEANHIIDCLVSMSGLIKSLIFSTSLFSNHAFILMMIGTFSLPVP